MISKSPTIMKERHDQELSSRNLKAIGCLASESLSGFKTSTTSPFTRRHTTSAILWICLMLCETIMIVMPRLFFSFSKTPSMCSVDIGSKALVGSSNSKTYHVIQTLHQKQKHSLARQFDSSTT